MRRRVAAGALACALLLVPLASCGIPDESGVVTQGAGPSPGTASGEDSAPARNGRDATVDKAQFVTNFLEAAAGEPENAVQQVRAFLAPADREAFKPPPEILVVHLTERPLINPGSPDVRLAVRQIGVLGRDGVLDPPSSPSSASEYQLTISGVEGSSGLFVTGGPSTLLISDTALQKFYQARPVYFWNAERTHLVPDIRYMPREVPNERQPTEILKWLQGGPSRWLAGAVEALPEGTEVIGNVPAVGGKLQITLSAPAAAVDPQQLGEQLMWSLRLNLSRELEVRIGQQVLRYSGDTYLKSNPAWRSTAVPERFALVDGQIRRMKTSALPNDPVPLLDDATNRNIRYAAMTRSAGTNYTALVVNDGNKVRLKLGSGIPGQPPSFFSTVLPDPVSRPVWAHRPQDGEPNNAQGLIVAGGRLYSFATNGAEPKPVEWPGAPTGLTAVAAAPDGNRIAVIAGGRLYVVALASAGGVMRGGQPRLVEAALRDLTAVDWSSEGSLVIAGTQLDTGRVALVDITIDGASQEDRLGDIGNAQVSYLAAVPANPVSDSRSADVVAYVAENVAYDALASPQRIDLLSVVGQFASPSQANQPTAPFFLN